MFSLLRRAGQPDFKHRRARPRWFGHEVRREEYRIIRRAVELEAEGRRLRGRLKSIPKSIFLKLPSE